MVGVLLDTCILSDLQRAKPDPRVLAQIEERETRELFVSVVTIGELAKGVALLDESRRKHELRVWLDGIERRFEDQILPVDHDVARIWGELTARAQRSGVRIPAADGLITATAVRHGLQVMTRNTRRFAVSGALVIDPWAE